MRECALPNVAATRANQANRTFREHAMHTQHNLAAIKVHAMTLTASKEPAQNFAGGVRFAMMDGAQRIMCWVSREALDRIKGRDHGLNDPMKCFELRRPSIEDLASQKYEAGERSPVVMSFDFETQL
jgi:Protein of unknown function (DUF1488)